MKSSIPPRLPKLQHIEDSLLLVYEGRDPGHGQTWKLHHIGTVSVLVLEAFLEPVIEGDLTISLNCGSWDDGSTIFGVISTQAVEEVQCYSKTIRNGEIAAAFNEVVETLLKPYGY